MQPGWRDASGGDRRQRCQPRPVKEASRAHLRLSLPHLLASTRGDEEDGRARPMLSELWRHDAACVRPGRHRLQGARLLSHRSTSCNVDLRSTNNGPCASGGRSLCGVVSACQGLSRSQLLVVSAAASARRECGASVSGISRGRRGVGRPPSPPPDSSSSWRLSRASRCATTAERVQPGPLGAPSRHDLRQPARRRRPYV